MRELQCVDFKGWKVCADFGQDPMPVGRVRTSRFETTRLQLTVDDDRGHVNELDFQSLVWNYSVQHDPAGVVTEVCFTREKKAVVAAPRSDSIMTRGHVFIFTRPSDI